MINEIKGWHVAVMFCTGFAIIIAVNLTLAFSAIRTFPGLEVKNSYVASQQFELKRNAQSNLNWQVFANISGNQLELHILQDGKVIAPSILEATFGRATHVGDDQVVIFAFDGEKFVAPITPAKGNWNLRLQAQSDEGVRFEQRIIVGQER